MNTLESYNKELYHYGIVGMKWGKRRSQTELDRLAGRKLARIDRQKNSAARRTENAKRALGAEKNELNDEIESNKEGIAEAARGKIINKAERLNTQHEIDRLRGKSLRDEFLTKFGEQLAKDRVDAMSKRLIELDESDSEHDRTIANYMSDNAQMTTRIKQIDKETAALGRMYINTIAKLDKKADKIKKKYNQ